MCTGAAAYSNNKPLPPLRLRTLSARCLSTRANPPGAFRSHRTFLWADKPDGTEVSEEDFQSFLDRKVTPRFPDGLTVLSGKGQFCCDAAGQLVQERSFVLVLLYPQETKESSSKKIERIRKDYKTEFQQQSVLRVDDPRPVRVSF